MSLVQKSVGAGSMETYWWYMVAPEKVTFSILHKAILLYMYVWLALWVGKINQTLLCEWLPKQERWPYLVCHVLQEKNSVKPYKKSFTVQACSVNMPVYRSCSIFFASLLALTPCRSINMEIKNLANIHPSWPRTWSITPDTEHETRKIQDSSVGNCKH